MKNTMLLSVVRSPTLKDWIKDIFGMFYYLLWVGWNRYNEYNMPRITAAKEDKTIFTPFFGLGKCILTSIKSDNQSHPQGRLSDHALYWNRQSRFKKTSLLQVHSFPSFQTCKSKTDQLKFYTPRFKLHTVDIQGSHHWGQARPFTQA